MQTLHCISLLSTGKFELRTRLTHGGSESSWSGTNSSGGGKETTLDGKLSRDLEFASPSWSHNAVRSCHFSVISKRSKFPCPAYHDQLNPRNIGEVWIHLGERWPSVATRTQTPVSVRPRPPPHCPQCHLLKSTKNNDSSGLLQPCTSFPAADG